jgi:acetate kinase
MKILVVNAGSSSLKYQLIDMGDDSVLLAKGLCERIGIDGKLKHEASGKDKYEVEASMPSHDVAIQLVLDTLIDKTYGVINDIREIEAVGHRVVHGGEAFTSSALITDEFMAALEANVELAPLHNPPNITGIRACRKVLGANVPQVGVFDTAFHQTMPDYAYIYALPYSLYEDYKVRRYGFHGTSHKYVAEQCAKLLGKDIKDTKIITCHLGNGSSVTAIEGGKSMENSMGFTPLEGLPMGTRCGDIDPGIIQFVMNKKNISIDEVMDVLNKKSGVLGVSGISSDFRDLDAKAQEGNDRARLSLDLFNYSVRKLIGAYITVLGGIDAIVFTAGIGENSATTRAAILDNLEFLGIGIDAKKNETRGTVDISADGAKVKVFVIPTNEELAIAIDTKAIVEAI